MYDTTIGLWLRCWERFIIGFDATFGLTLSAGDPAGQPCVAAGSLGVDDEEERPKGSQGNPWNLSQHQFKGMGLTSTKLAKIYKKKSEGTKMP